MERFAAVKADPQASAAVFQRLSEGETLREIGEAWGCPAGGFERWYMTEHKVEYEAALMVKADRLAHEALTVADGAEAETLGPSKLQVETRRWVASKWDRERYGDKTEVKHSGIPPMLIIEVAGQVTAPRERVIEHAPATDELLDG